MTSTQTLIGTAATVATTGDLVSTTNPAGEILIGFVLQVIVGGSRLRPTTSYQVRVGSGRGSLHIWPAADCTWTTEQRAAKALTVGERVYVYARGDWRAATVLSVGAAGVVPDAAWQLLRVEAGR